MPDPIEQRLAELEAKIKDLKLEDLPMGAVQRKLENAWQRPSDLFNSEDPA